MLSAQQVIEKIKQAGLAGRGGAGFPTGDKWQAVKDSPETEKYVIGNGSEGEPEVYKDGWLLENRPQEIVEGLKLALKTVGARQGYVYLRHDYFGKYAKKLAKLIGDFPIEVVSKTGGYIAGEETVVIAALAGNRLVPAMRPPYPTTFGLHGKPTLVNNLETLYEAALIVEGIYEGTRLYSLAGDAPKTGVYELPESFTIRQVLERTKNWPKFEFFLQAGGAGSGEILNSSQLDSPLQGVGGLTIYNLKKTDLKKLLRGWVDFFATESCGQCTPCREGTYRLQELFSQEKVDWAKVEDILFVLEKSSFCALGCSVPNPILTLFKNVPQALEISA